ncbi:hypothetical protein HAX54_022937, partial [Datura stramonium]|nr:hypothetical protein [Datura stramonium]
MDQAGSQLALIGYPASQPSQSVHTSHPALTEHDSSQQAPTVQVASKKRSSRESMTHWIVDAIGFCGILACDCSLFPINFEKWSSLPILYFNRIYEQIIKSLHNRWLRLDKDLDGHKLIRIKMEYMLMKRQKKYA